MGLLSPVILRLSHRLYGHPIIRNVLRGELVEQFVLEALGDGWKAAGDYEAWDVESTDGAIRIQIKNGAARQSWSDQTAPPSRASFSIKPSRAWTQTAGRAIDAHRHANLYVFGWHPGTADDADHRIVEQWQFFVVPTALLPSGKSIGITNLSALSPEIGIADLAVTVSAHAKTCNSAQKA
jgi:hypothetical protein